MENETKVVEGCESPESNNLSLLLCKLNTVFYISYCSFKCNLQLCMLLLFRKHKFEWKEISIFYLTPMTEIKKITDANSVF